MLEFAPLRPAVRVDGEKLSTRLRVVRVALALCLWMTSDAHAQDVGDGTSALPGLVAMRVAAERDVGFALRLTTGYAYTQSAIFAPGPHHRIPACFALSGQATRWLGFGLALSGHGDFHPDDGRGPDRGFVGSGTFEVRATPRITDHVTLGGAFAMQTAGGASPSVVLGATSFELGALATFRARDVRIGLEAGYRIDRSANAIARAAIYRTGDLLALGYSSYDSLMLRVGVDYRRRDFEAFGEFVADPLLGTGRPSLAATLVRASLGARAYPNPRLQLELALGFAFVAPAPIRNDAPRLPVQPRFTLGLSATYRYGRTPTGAPLDATSNSREEATDEATRTLDGSVVDANGAPLVDAHLVVTVDDARLEGFTDADGRFRITSVPLGAGTIRVEATGHLPLERTFGRDETSLGGGAFQLVEGTPGGALRGLVRDFEARAVVATIRVEPGGFTTTASSEGAFVLDLPSGRYRVTIEAVGFLMQEREVDLRTGEVTILNVDLRESR